jgi:hypothetical protein
MVTEDSTHRVDNGPHTVAIETVFPRCRHGQMVMLRTDTPANSFSTSVSPRDGQNAAGAWPLTPIGKHSN